MPTALEMIPEIGPAERVFARPSWSDPAFMVHANQWLTRLFTIAGTAANIIAPADPKRWGIAFQQADADVSQYLVAPHNDVATFGNPLSANFRDNLYSIFEYGPMVTGEWYIIGTAGNVVRVYEIQVSQ